MGGSQRSARDTFTRRYLQAMNIRQSLDQHGKLKDRKFSPSLTHPQLLADSSLKDNEDDGKENHRDKIYQGKDFCPDE